MRPVLRLRNSSRHHVRREQEFASSQPLLKEVEI